MTRRDCLRLGLGALLGGGLVDALRLRGQAAIAGAARPTSCILIWMDGGPSHYETFDPKPDAPAEIRGEFKPIATKVPGVQFSEHMTRLAAIADKLAIVRSIRHDQGNHGAGNHYMMTGAPPRIPVGCGAFVSFHPSLGLGRRPRARGRRRAAGVLLDARACRARAGRTSSGRSTPRSSSPTTRTAPDFRVRDVALPRGLDRASGSTAAATCGAEVDRFQRFADKAAGDPAVALDEYYEQGYDLMSSQEAQARVRHRARADRGPRRATAATRSASVPCSPAGWSRPACRSSRSTTAAGTTTPSIFDALRQAAAGVRDQPSPP